MSFINKVSQKMYTDRYSGIWAERILIFEQFWAGEAAAKNFFDMNEKLNFLDTLASALNSHTILKQKKNKFLLRSMPFGGKIGYMPYFK